MAEWKRVRLGEVADLLSGFPFDGHKYSSDGVRVVRGENVSKGKLRWNADKRWNEPFEKESIYSLRLHDVVVSMDGNVGKNRSRILKDDLPLLLAQRVARLRAKESVADQLFLYYCILSQDFEQYIDSIKTGTTISHISLCQLSEYEIPLPPLATQKKIAAVLGAIDDKIEANRKICANLEAQAQALFKSWFVDSSENVERIVQMQEAFEVTIGRTPPRKEFKWFSECRGDNVVWVSIADMGGCGTFIADSSEYLTQEAVERFGLNIVPKDTVLLSFKLTVGRVAIAATNLVTNEAIAHLRTSDSLMREYLYCYLRQFNYDTLGSTSSIATAVNSKTIREMPFAVPKRESLKKFHDVAANVFDQIREMLSESRALASMRDALLPKLMSGEIDVENVEVA